MAKKAWWDPTGWFGGGEDDSQQATVQNYTLDPAKKAVSDKFSAYLSDRVGMGMSPYSGDLTTTLDPAAQSRYNEYLGSDPATLFKTAVTDPTIREFQKTTLPEINESWAGYQSGSGRGYDQTQALSEMSYQLGVAGAKAVPSIYESQIKSGFMGAKLEAENKQVQYTEWLRQQPEYSPVLEQALKYLGKGTETGTGWKYPDVTSGSAAGTQGLDKLFSSGIEAFTSPEAMSAIASTIVAALQNSWAFLLAL